MSIKTNQFGIHTLTIAGKEFVSKQEILESLACTVSETVRLHEDGLLDKENATGVLNAMSVVASIITGIVDPSVQIAMDVNEFMRGVDLSVDE